MSIQQFDWSRLAYGYDRKRSIHWMKISGALFVLPPVLLGIWWVAASVGAVFPNDIASNVILVVLVSLGVLGVVAATVQAYLNDGFLASNALALAPVLGLLFFVGDALYVVLILGVCALVAGTAGFVVGAGARRLVIRVQD